MSDLLAARPDGGVARLPHHAAPRITLVLWALAVGALVLFPSLLYLLRVFKREAAHTGQR